MKKQKIRCKDVLNHICEKLDIDLDSARCRTIKKHIKECPDCLAYLDSMKKTIWLYRAYPNPVLPKGAQKKLFASLKIHS